MADEPEIVPRVNLVRAVWDSVRDKENRFAVIVLMIALLEEVDAFVCRPCEYW